MLRKPEDLGFREIMKVTYPIKRIPDSYALWMKDLLDTYGPISFNLVFKDFEAARERFAMGESGEGIAVPLRASSRLEDHPDIHARQDWDRTGIGGAVCFRFHDPGRSRSGSPTQIFVRAETLPGRIVEEATVTEGARSSEHF